MPGCASRAAVRASRWNRATNRRSADELRAEHLDGDRPIQAQVGGLVDLAHAAAAEQPRAARSGRRARTRRAGKRFGAPPWDGDATPEPRSPARQPGRPPGYGARGMGVIEIEGLRKEYRRLRRGRTVAVDGLDLDGARGRRVRVPRSERGRARRRRSAACSGSCGRARAAAAARRRGAARALPSVIARVGSIVETPALFPRFTGRRNLEILGAHRRHRARRGRRGARTRRPRRTAPTTS